MGAATSVFNSTLVDPKTVDVPSVYCPLLFEDVPFDSLAHFCAVCSFYNVECLLAHHPRRITECRINCVCAQAEFRASTPEAVVVAVADRCYGIALQDRVSEIRSLERFEAQKFMKDLMLEEEAVGPITTQSGSNRGGGHRNAANNGAGGATRGSSGAARGVPLQLHDELEAEEEEGSENEGEEGSGDEEDEEVTSPAKIRRIQRGTATAKPRTGKAASKDRGKGQGRAGQDSESEVSNVGESTSPEEEEE